MPTPVAAGLEAPVAGERPQRADATLDSTAAEGADAFRRGRVDRLWIALGVSVAFIVGGAWVLWSQLSRPEYFTGRGSSPTEQAFMQFIMGLTPGVVQAGVVGVVAVLVAWALRARRSEGHGR